MNKDKDRGKAQVLEGVVSIITNTALFGVKFWAGLVSGSIALIADAWHTLSDTLSSVIVIAAEKLANRKADKEHPFGHGRWELIATMIIAFFLAMIGYEFFIGSIERLKTREAVSYGTIALVVTIASIVMKELLAQFAFYLGKKHDNQVISADGWHHRTDALSSVIVLIGIIVTKFVPNLWWMDGALGMMCALAIFYAAFEIMKGGINKILGECPEQAFIDELTTQIKEIHNSDLELHHVHIHNYVTHQELTMHIRLDDDMTIKEGHEKADFIEKMITEKFGMESTIHVEPMSGVHEKK